MSSAIPLNLTLDFAGRGDQATIRWHSEHLDGGVTDFRSPYGSAELPAVIKALDALQAPQSFDGAELNILAQHQLLQEGIVAQRAPHRVGETLYRSLGPQAAAFIEQTISYARHTGRPINYILRFPPECVELAALPWELLRSSRHFLLMRPDAQDSCERHILFGQAPPAPLPESHAPHALVLLPHFAMGDADRAAQLRIFEALQRRGALTYEVLSPVTPEGLDAYLRGAPRRPEIIHYAGHGVYYEQEGWLLFDGAGQNTQRVSAEQFSALVGTVHLAVIQACQSAMVAEGELLTGIAPALNYAAAAVVAMQLTVRTSAAHRFAEILYEELLIKAQSLRVAVARARRNLFGTEQEAVSWFVPTLYLRVPPQLARGQVVAPQPASERAIVAAPIREVVVSPITVGPLELTLARDPESGQWQMVARNQSTVDVEAIVVTATRMPPGVRLHPHQIKIPRARAGDRSAPVPVTLTVGTDGAGAKIPISLTCRVTATGLMERHTGTLITMLASEGQDDGATPNG